MLDLLETGGDFLGLDWICFFFCGLLGPFFFCLLVFVGSLFMQMALSFCLRMRRHFFMWLFMSLAMMSGFLLKGWSLLPIFIFLQLKQSSPFLEDLHRSLLICEFYLILSFYFLQRVIVQIYEPFNHLNVSIENSLSCILYKQVAIGIKDGKVRTGGIVWTWLMLDVYEVSESCRFDYPDKLIEISLCCWGEDDFQ